MDIHSDFELKQKVKILPFNMEGCIEGVYYSYYGVKYYVTFYHELDEKTGYFCREELEAI